MLGPNGAYLMVTDTGDPRPITQGHRFDYDRDATEQAVLLVRSVATMLPRPGSTRGDSRGRESTSASLADARSSFGDNGSRDDGAPQR